MVDAVLNSADIEAAGGDPKARLNPRSFVGRYETPDFLPCIIDSSYLSVWAPTTVYTEGKFASVDAWVFRCLKSGTSGSTAPTGYDPVITDGTALWVLFGYLAPVTFENSLAIVKGRKFAANGMMFQVTTAGTFHASDPAPDAAAGGTHGTVGYVYLGPQEIPIVSLAGSDTPFSGTSSRAAWNSPNLTIAGGTLLQDGGNGWARIGSISLDGSAYVSGTLTNKAGSGSLMFQTDAPKFSERFRNLDTGSAVWVDGKYAAFIIRSNTTAVDHVLYDCSGLPRKFREVRHKVNWGWSLISVFATGKDTIRPAADLGPSVVSVGDSFTENPVFAWPGLLSEAMGLANWRISGRGDTGLLDTSANCVNHLDRWDVDVTDHMPDYVVIPLSQNDTSFTAAEIVAALQSAIDLTIANSPASRIVVIGMWNNRAPLASGVAYDADVAAEALCASLEIPFIGWRNLLEDGGYVGNVSGTDGVGNSSIYTQPDGTHPTIPQGYTFRRDYLLPRMIEAFAL